MNVTLRVAAIGLALPPILMAAGCAAPSAPQPPSLKMPAPVADLAVARSGDEVHLHWTMPKRTTDRVILKDAQHARICRRVDSGPCEIAADQVFAPDAGADFRDRLPPAEASGPRRPLTYTIELLNQKGRSAGPSNAALTAAGAAPTQVDGLSATAVQDGVQLKWTPSPSNETIRIHRTLIETPGSPKSTPAPGIPPLPEQTLEVTGHDQGQAIDRDAALDHTYRYSAERVEPLTLESRSFEVLSSPSLVVTVNARDVFPPATPRDLQVVADSEAHAIDLSWAPNTERDLAGYIVYRRDMASSTPAIRVSPPNEVAPSFRDAGALPGHRYAYSVSAIDRDGNESPHSAETEESLPQP
ncbi:MAG TPA: fibronectin type III domain-containing protein [Silvibacterium sp.]|nr:fibronectin type III domain-containing protein [Silvibacterium sp.]